MNRQKTFAALLFFCASLALGIGCGGSSNDEANETTCDDRIDNDGDGAVDCKDPDCADAPRCRNEHCYNLADDDGDGDVDCDDSDCNGVAVCSGLGEDCVNQIEDDGDGDADCEDVDCANTAACTPGGENCVDGQDNDGDGDVDCDDPDCANTAVCVERVEDCEDGEDNDGDGAADCDDSDCARTSVCTDDAENCTNGTDDDGDGRVDCLDIDCAYTAACLGLAEDCENGIDDDGDGAIDCQDSECQATSACVRLCTVDSDGDGVVDCEDPDVDDDGVDNPEDNCPTTPNADQADTCDDDGIGDACQDNDGDGINDADDNCCLVPNAEQANRDADADPNDNPTAPLGNACDPAETYAYADWAIELPALSGSNVSTFGNTFNLTGTGDFDGDGQGDVLISTTEFQPRSYFVPGTAQTEQTYTVTEEDLLYAGPEFSYELPFVNPTVGDVNGDGIDDLVYSYQPVEAAEPTKRVHVMFGPFTSGDDVGPAVDSTFLDTDMRIRSLDVADFDGDGSDDILVALQPDLESGPGKVVLLPGQDAPAEPLTMDDALFEVSTAPYSNASRAVFTHDFLSYQGTSGTVDVAIYVIDAYDQRGGLYLLAGERIADDVANSPDAMSDISSASTVFSAGPSDSLDRNFEFARDITGDGNTELLMGNARCSDTDSPRGIFMAEIRSNASGLQLIGNSAYRLGCNASNINYDWSDYFATADLNGDSRDELFLKNPSNLVQSAYYESVGSPTTYSLDTPSRTFEVAGLPPAEVFATGALRGMGLLGDVNGDGVEDHYTYYRPSGSLDLRPEPAGPTVYVYFWP